VKFVDRLDFTLQNNQKRGPSVNLPLEGSNPFSRFSPPLNRWAPGTAFVVMKGQPVHSGHIKMIKLAEKALGAVTVLASNKAPNFEVENWKEIGSAPTLKKIS